MVNVVIWLEKAITCVLSQHVVEYLSVWIDNFEQGIDVNSLGTGKNDCFNFTLCIDQVFEKVIHVVTLVHAPRLA